MTKKVLILSASPRKGGNSDLLCDQFLLGAKEAGNQVDKIFLRDKTIIAWDAAPVRITEAHAFRRMTWLKSWKKWLLPMRS